MTGELPRLVIHGAGRMGRLVHDAAQQGGFQVVAIVSRRRPDWQQETPWLDSFENIDQHADLLMDFSLPAGTVAAAGWCEDKGVALLSGTTGLRDEQFEALKSAARSVPVLWAANFSVGVNLCLELVALAAQRLASVESVRVTDVHHVHKKDAPSGTALALGAAAAPLEVEFDSIREGEVVGSHDVRFKLHGEEVCISHEANDRGIYARGALRAGHWLLTQKPAFYGVSDAFS